MSKADVSFLYIEAEDFNTQTYMVVSLEVTSGEQVPNGKVIATVETSKKNIELQASKDGYFYSLLNIGDIAKVSRPFGVISNQKLLANELDVLLHKKNQTNSHVSVKAKKYLERFQVKDEEINKNEIKVADVLEFLKTQKGISISDFSGVITKSIEIFNSNHLTSYVSTEFSYSHLQKKLSGCSEALQIDVNVDTLFCFCVHKALKEFPKLSAFIDGHELVELTNYPVGLYVSNGEKAGETFVLSNDSLSSLEKTAEKVFSAYRSYLTGESFGLSVPAGLFISNLMSLKVNHFIPLIKNKSSSTLAISAPNSSGYYNVGLSFDHRIVDGHYVSRFLNLLKNLIEETER